MDGMLFLAPGGMSTRRSGLRLFMPRFMGGGDLACMFLFMPPGETSRPGELRWFPYPFPEAARGDLGYKKYMCTHMDTRNVFFFVWLAFNPRLCVVFF